MQTPLMELIEWNNKEILDAKHVIDNAKDYDERIVSMADHYYMAHYQVKTKATELLEKERAIIEQAHAAGLCKNCFSGVSDTAKKVASDYFTKTFTGKKD